MATIVTFGILAATGVVLWWLLQDALSTGRRSGRARCAVCGGRETERIGARLRCVSCGAQFKAHAAWHWHEPTLPAVSAILLAFVALLLLALFDLLLSWRVFGTARAGLIALAAAVGTAAAVCSFLKHRRQYGRN